MSQFDLNRDVMNTNQVEELLRKLDGVFISGTTDGTPGTESSHAHTLGRVPRGILVLGKDKAAHIYDGSSANDASNVYVRSDVATVAFKAYVF